MVQHNYSTKPGTLETQSFERFQQFINGLDKVKEVVGDQIGLKRLDRLLELSGVYDRTPDTQPAFAKDNISRSLNKQISSILWRMPTSEYPITANYQCIWIVTQM